MESLSEASPISFLISHWLTSLVGLICLVDSYAYSLPHTQDLLTGGYSRLSYIEDSQIMYRISPALKYRSGQE